MARQIIPGLLYEKSQYQIIWFHSKLLMGNPCIWKLIYKRRLDARNIA